MTGPWTMTEDGEWELVEPYASEVLRIRLAAAEGFNHNLCTELAKVTEYGYQELCDEYVRYCQERQQDEIDKLTSFIVEALMGQLFE